MKKEVLKLVNGVSCPILVDMTPQEIAELEANKPIEEPQPTKEELMAKLAEIQEQLNKM